jgi:hypothetical protein
VGRVIIGMDPHKRSATIEIIDSHEHVLGAGRFRTDQAGYQQMLAVGRQRPDRVWAIEGCAGIGRHLAQRLVADGETVWDVPAKLSAQVRVFATGQGRKTVTANAEELRTLAIAAGTSHEALVTAHLTYGEDSAYTAFAARFHPGPLLLDEHYRCHPEIIKYCNQQFYDNKLTILTSVDRDGDPPRGLEWHDVDGRTEPGRSGSALNEAEAEAVVDWVLGSGLSAERLGVVTPFRAQAAKIRELLRQHGQGQVDGIRVGTAHTFQGGERDTIVFSTVISTGAMSGTVGWLEGERNLINVAVSRARQHLVVFGNRAELARARARTLLSLAQAASDVGRHPVAATTLATSRLHAALVARGLPASLGEVDEGYPLAITLSAINGDRIDIEVDEYPEGDPGGRTQRQRATRDANIRRLGWQVVRVPGWQAYLDPDAIAEHMWQVVTR